MEKILTLDGEPRNLTINSVTLNYSLEETSLILDIPNDLTLINLVDDMRASIIIEIEINGLEVTFTEVDNVMLEFAEGENEEETRAQIEITGTLSIT